MASTSNILDKDTSVARHQQMRETNLRLVNQAIFRAQHPLSRVEVAHQTGLSRGAVTSLVDSLIAGRIVRELPVELSGSVGRPKIGLVPASRTILGLGLSVDPERIGICLLDLCSEVIVLREEFGNYKGSDPARVLADLGSLATQAIQEADWEGMKVACGHLSLPGVINSSSGMLISAPALGWAGFDPVKLLGLNQTPVVANNNAKLAGLAQGQANQLDNFLFVNLGSGVGGAIIVNHNVFEISPGWNSEIGHTLADPNGPPCSCGAQGCLEQYVCRPALARAMGLPTEATVADMVAAVRAGQPKAVAALDDAATKLGDACSNFVNLVGIPTIMIGGALVPLLPYMKERLEAEVRSRVLGSEYMPLQIIAGTVDEHAELIGAAQISITDVIDYPLHWLSFWNQGADAGKPARVPTLNLRNEISKTVNI